MVDASAASITLPAFTLQNKAIFLFWAFLFSFLHAMVYYDFFVLNHTISFWKDFQSEKFLSITLFSHFLFIFVFGNVISHFELINSSKFNFRTFFEYNHSIFYLLSLIGLYIIFFGITGRVITTSSACTSGSLAIGYGYESIKNSYLNHHQ
jgi:hypothetical protein